MQIGLVTDSLAHLPLETLLPTVSELGITMVEFGCGNWSPAPHLRLDAMLGSATMRTAFLAKLQAHGLTISALNCSGNPLLPGTSGEPAAISRSRLASAAVSLRSGQRRRTSAVNSYPTISSDGRDFRSPSTACAPYVVAGGSC